MSEVADRLREALRAMSNAPHLVSPVSPLPTVPLLSVAAGHCPVPPHPLVDAPHGPVVPAVALANEQPPRPPASASPSVHKQLQSIYGRQDAKRAMPGDPAEARQLNVSTKGVPGGLFANAQGRDVTADRNALQRSKALAQKLKQGGGLGRGCAAQAVAVATKPRAAWITEDQMGPEQRRAFRRIMKNDSELSGNNTCVTGPGGSGKSFLIQALVQRWKRHGIQYRITATTGVAAANIGGLTFHSLMRMGKLQDAIRKLKFRAMGNRDLKDDIEDLEAMVLDEISMWAPRMIRLLDEMFRALRPAKRHLPFGGVQMIFMGDFCQLSHVFSDDDRQWTERLVKKLESSNPDEALAESDNLIYSYCFQHPLWQQYIGFANTILLRKNFRQGNDPLLARICDKMRLGNVDQEVHQVLSQRCIATAKMGDGVGILRETGIKPTEIYAKNADADRVNDRELQRLEDDPNKHFVYKYMDIRIDQTKRAKKVFDLFIANQQKDSLVKGEIRLAVGSRVMLLANLDVGRGLANGTQGNVIGQSEPRETVHDPTPRPYPLVRFDNGEVEVIEPRAYECNYDSDDKDEATAMCFYVQVPLRLSDAFSVHKSQGQTLPSIFGDMRMMYHAGQAYTFVSRVKSLEGLFIRNYSRSSIVTNQAVKDYYRELEEYEAQHVEHEAENDASTSASLATETSPPVHSSSDPVLAMFE